MRPVIETLFSHATPDVVFSLSALLPLRGHKPATARDTSLKEVYQGSVRHAADMVMQGRACSGDFQLISGYSGWGAFQLAAEMQDQVW